MGFDSLTIDKTSIMKKIVSDQDLSKAIYYNETSFKSKPNISPELLLYNNIFPYFFIPDINEKQKTFVTLSFKNFSYRNNVFMGGNMQFNIFTHQSLYRTDYGELRTDYIVNKIHEMFNQTRGSWMGKLNLYSMDELIINPNFSGNYLVYKMIDFQ